MTNFSSLASAAGLSGTQYKLRYEQSSCRLELTGLPDVTATSGAGQPQQQLTMQVTGPTYATRRYTPPSGQPGGGARPISMGTGALVMTGVPVTADGVATV